MADITVIFDLGKGGPVKERATTIAERYEIHKEKDKIKAVFHKFSPDLLTLLELCRKFPSSLCLVGDNEFRIPEVLKVLKCTYNDYCGGLCEKGDHFDFELKKKIENASKGICDEFSDPESLRLELNQIKGIKQESDGTFRINKGELKKNLLKDCNLQLQICEFIDHEGMIEYIDQLPDTFTISDEVTGTESEFEGLSDYQIAEYSAQAEIMGPIIAKHVAREMDKVFVANFGSETNASFCERKGDYLFELGRYQESVNCFDKALAFDSKNKGALFGKAISLYYDDKFENALQPLDVFLSLETDNPRAWKIKGECLENLGKYEEAIKSYTHSRELFSQELENEPDRQDDLNDLEWVNQRITEIKSKF